jgi:hypothetical protein
VAAPLQLFGAVNGNLALLATSSERRNGQRQTTHRLDEGPRLHQNPQQEEHGAAREG